MKNTKPQKKNHLTAKINGQFFTWSLENEMRTQLSRSISFFEAATIFSDPFYLELPVNQSEKRFRCVGIPETHRHILAVTYNFISFENILQIQIICAMEAIEKEINAYEQHVTEMIEEQSYLQQKRLNVQKKRKLIKSLNEA